MARAIASRGIAVFSIELRVWVPLTLCGNRAGGQPFGIFLLTNHSHSDDTTPVRCHGVTVLHFRVPGPLACKDRGFGTARRTGQQLN
jgi:hypothetical protein